jgi:3-isopropylmalate dehydrogenase
MGRSTLREQGVVTARVAVIAGDGIGPEVIGPALDVLPAGIETVHLDVGAARFLATGEVLTPADVAAVSSCDALLFGAVGDPRVPDGVLERGIILRLRNELDLYINLRPFPDLGVVFVRENTEGLYSGVGASDGELATETSVNTRRATTRCVEYAFTLAEARSRVLTLVHKTNILMHAGPLWRGVVDEIARTHPEVEVRYEHVDAAAYHLVTDPSRFDVVVTDNLFGDILSDLAAGLSGGLGRAASANLHPEDATRPTRCIGMFEPVHGSAPDIAGKGLADPTAAVEVARMLVGALRERELLPA